MENILNRSIIAFGYSFVFLFCLFLSEVSFEIQFELNSIILEKIIGFVFFQSVRSIVKAFEEQCLKSNNFIS